MTVLLTGPPTVAAVVVASLVLLAWLTGRIRAGREVGLRPLRGYDALARQIGKAVESGRKVHFALGRAGLAGQGSPTSLAALAALDHVAADGCPSDVPPLVTAGEATLLPAGQDSLRHAYEQAGRRDDFSPGMAQFVAGADQPMAYAAGVAEVMRHAAVGSNLLIGHFGSELAIMTEAAGRERVEQVVGTDDPVAIALAAAATEDLLIGEEMFAAAAYLQKAPSQIASLQVQDILRWAAAAGILAAAAIQFLAGL